MGKQAGWDKGAVLAIGCLVALLVGMAWFTYWVSHGDLVTIGVVAVVSLIGGAYTLTRRRPPTVPPATADGRSEQQLLIAAAEETHLGRLPRGPAGPPVPTSHSLSRLASLLATEKGYKPVESAESTFSFVGRRRHWGSHAWIALVGADELDRAGIERFAKHFYDLVWNDVSLIGMGSYGILCFVFEDTTPSPEIVQHIRSLKRAPAKGNWMVYWTMDLVTGRVISHSGSPWGLFPGRAYLEKAIRS
jgi:hypothetical protein